ncbi:glycoside hydrolase family 97 protein [Aquirufa ecclesiirivi]|uniref:Glycoside hydrolase family 97 protein n=1 Tax=Aquirufa ecclesiirivi TaxID=2715124 RepID=A0ABT4JI38_9BACT|nr:glycoside hydrolase family 97 protein [Aquirufa ecclesiirivi]MCZ2475926.1 glycoside hydrolase family 97 protein [Aquirufa ecclesiirivi]
MIPNQLKANNPLFILLPFFIVLILIYACQQPVDNKITELLSPDKKIKVQLFSAKKNHSLQYTISFHDTMLVEKSSISLDLEGEDYDQLIIKDIQAFHVDTLFSPIIAAKRKVFRDHYNGIQINFEQALALEIRMYDEGLAFRWIGKSNHDLKVLNETFEVNPVRDANLFYAQYEQDATAGPGFINFIKRKILQVKNYLKGKKAPSESAFETPYQHKKISEIDKNSFLFVPALIQTQDGKYIVIGESDVIDYPGMILQNSSQNRLTTSFSAYPLKEEFPKDTLNYMKQVHVSEFADYIALTKGKRTFPWRVLMITDQPASIPASDLIQKLASPSALQGDLSWIKPGQITDEWLTNINLFNVDFQSGKNTASYKYYIDFAKTFGLEYIMIDEGWYLNGTLKNLNKNINIDSIATYAKEKNVGLGLWFNAMVLNENLEETLKTYSSKGVNVILIDFINRNDQKAMNYYVKIAEACARYKLMLNIHSAPAPAGFEITYPNAISREGVLGSEWNGWSPLVTPNHDLTIPFTRMFSGPLDYEPGLLENSTENGFQNIPDRPMSQGTRAHQIAMYLIYDNPLQYFVGNPSQGYKEPKLMKFVGNIPTTWDETIVLDGKPSEYIVTARLKDGIWYIGALNNWKERELTIDLSKFKFKKYTLTGIIDGINSNRYAADYVMTKGIGNGKEILKIRLGKGGGGVWRFESERP